MRVLFWILLLNLNGYVYAETETEQDPLDVRLEESKQLETYRFSILPFKPTYVLPINQMGGMKAYRVVGIVLNLVLSLIIITLF